MKLIDNLYSIINSDSASRTFRLRLHGDSVIYRAHFPGHPVTPGVCLIRIAEELLSMLYATRLELRETVNAKFLTVLDPREQETVDFTFNKVEMSEDGHTVKAGVTVSAANKVFTKLSLIYDRI